MTMRIKTGRKEGIFHKLKQRLNDERADSASSNIPQAINCPLSRSLPQVRSGLPHTSSSSIDRQEWTESFDSDECSTDLKGTSQLDCSETTPPDRKRAMEGMSRLNMSEPAPHDRKRAMEGMSRLNSSVSATVGRIGMSSNSARPVEMTDAEKEIREMPSSIYGNEPILNKPNPEKSEKSVSHKQVRNKFATETERKQWEDKLYKVKPLNVYPPPNNQMTNKDLYKEMMKPSKVFSELSSSFPTTPASKSKKPICCPICPKKTKPDNRIGSLELEVLGCVGLPSRSPSAIAYCILGDCAFTTDIIPACRSPMWPRKSTRACIFPLFHAYANLYVAVFGSTYSNSNDLFLGRVVLEMSAIRPYTEYDVTLPLKKSAHVYDRQARGVVRLRFRMHWCCENDAIMSYLRGPVEKVFKYVSIPCADAKTLRNVAITVYGAHYPGKTSMKMFRATLRELDLYRVQIASAIGRATKDAMFWENPLLSAYLFFGWMKCVRVASLSLIPPYIVGLVILTMLNNYVYYVKNDQMSHEGYAPITLKEILLALFYGKRKHGTHVNFIKPGNVKKKITVSGYGSAPLKEQLKMMGLDEMLKCTTVSSETSLISGKDVGFSFPKDGPLHHSEFPFSDGHTYPPFSIDEALNHKTRFGGRNNDWSKSKLNRLSMYQLNIPQSKNSFENDKAEADFAQEDRTDDFVNSSDSDNDDDLSTSHSKSSFKRSSCDTSQNNTPSLPEQNNDVKVPRKPRDPNPENPLPKIENTIHNVTGRLFYEALFPKDEVDDYNDNEDENYVRDEFESRLGLIATNRINTIQIEHLGPVLRMVQVFLKLVRVCVNIYVWKDPILSFWFTCLLTIMSLVMYLFPWRMLMYVVGLVLLGPQNKILKPFIDSLDDFKKDPVAKTDISTEPLQRKASEDEGAESDDTKHASGRSRTVQKRPPLNNDGSLFSSDDSFTHIRTQSSLSMLTLSSSLSSAHTEKLVSANMKKGIKSRSVKVPYTPLRLERFYDWPPPASVSRAKPIETD